MSSAEYWLNKEFINTPYGFIIAHREFININVSNKEKDCVFFSHSLKQ